MEFMIYSLIALPVVIALYTGIGYVAITKFEDYIGNAQF